jgi:hypothetical protein
MYGGSPYNNISCLGFFIFPVSDAANDHLSRTTVALGSPERGSKLLPLAKASLTAWRISFRFIAVGFEETD